jgi:Fic family protein
VSDQPERKPDGKFIGQTPEECGTKVKAVLRTGKSEGITMAQIRKLTGLSTDQVTKGINYLRTEVGDDSVVTHAAGQHSTYWWAATIEDVRQYADRRIRIWCSQVKVIHRQMENAISILHGTEDRDVVGVINMLDSALKTFEHEMTSHEYLKAQLAKAQNDLEKEKAKNRSRRSRAVA